MDGDLIRIKKISEKTGISTATLRSYIKQNKLKAIKIGGNYYTTPENYNKLLLNFWASDMGMTVDQLIEGYKRLQKEESLKKMMY